MDWISGNIFIRENVLDKAGDKREGHKHNFDYTTIFWQGAFRVRATLPDGRKLDQKFAARGHPRASADGLQSHALIRAGVEHEITALEDNCIFWCVYSHREPQEPHVVSQVQTGWREAYQ